MDLHKSVYHRVTATVTTPKLLQLCLSRSWGGLEMVTLELAQSYHQRGVFVRTVCQTGSRLEERLKKAGLPHLSIKAGKYFDPAAISKLRRAFNDDAITTVVLQQLRDIWHVRPALIGFPKIRLSGFAHIFLSVSKHGVGHRWLYGRMDNLICLTEIQKHNFAQHLPVDASRIVVIPNAVDKTVFRPEKRSEEVRRSLGARPDEVLIGVIGRLDESKGQVETVEAARLLKAQGLRIKVVLVGEDTLNLTGTRARLEKLITEANLQETVCLAGFRADIPDVIASLDILAMPSWAETFGRVLLEAMASKVPVIATRAGGVPDIIDDEKNGLLVPARDSAALAEGLKKYLREPDFARKCAEAGYQKMLETYELKKVEDQMDWVLLQAR